MVAIIVKMVPLVIFCSIISIVVSTGFDMLLILSKMILAAIIGACAMLLVYALLAAVLAGLNPVKYFKKMWNVSLTGFVLSSPNAVDQILDMFATSLNVTGDVMGATVVARRENLMDMDIFNE